MNREKKISKSTRMTRSYLRAGITVNKRRVRLLRYQTVILYSREGEV